MTDKLLPDETKLSQFRMFDDLHPGEDFRTAALDGARGPAEIKAAAIDILLVSVTHDHGGRRRLAELAAVAQQVGVMRWEDYERTTRLSDYTSNAEFARLRGKVQAALETLPAEALKRLADCRITEDERPPMQFSAQGPIVEMGPGR